MTPDVTSSMEILVRNREEAGIQSETQFLLAISGSLPHLREHDCLRIACAQAGLQNLSIITSTNLRKYVATFIQLFDLTENETDWGARHLGHDIRVHRDFYRNHGGITKTTQVSKILMAI